MSGTDFPLWPHDRLAAIAGEMLKYCKLEEVIENFDCPHDAEERCACVRRLDAMINSARAWRKEALKNAETKYGTLEQTTGCRDPFVGGHHVDTNITKKK